MIKNRRLAFDSSFNTDFKDILKPPFGRIPY